MSIASNPLIPNRPEPNIFCIQDYPGNIFGVRVRVPIKWHPVFNEYEYSDCSNTMLENWFRKYPHLFVFHTSIFPPQEKETPSTPPLTEEREKVLRWVKANERPPDKFGLEGPIFREIETKRVFGHGENPDFSWRNPMAICFKNCPFDLPVINQEGIPLAYDCDLEWLEEIDLSTTSPQTEEDIWLNIDMPEYLKDGRDKGRFSWEQGYKAAEARYRNPPSSPPQTEEREGEVPEEIDWKTHDKDSLIWHIHVKKLKIKTLQSQLSEAIKERDTYKKILDEYGKV